MSGLPRARFPSRTSHHRPLRLSDSPDLAESASRESAGVQGSLSLRVGPFSTSRSGPRPHGVEEGREIVAGSRVACRLARLVSGFVSSPSPQVSDALSGPSPNVKDVGVRASDRLCPTCTPGSNQRWARTFRSREDASPRGPDGSVGRDRAAKSGRIQGSPRFQRATATTGENRQSKTSSTEHADRSGSRYPAARPCTSGWPAEVKSPPALWSVRRSRT